MRKALIIVAAVGGYSLFELGVLLSILPMRLDPMAPPTSQHQVSEFFAQLLLIPGLAALLSIVTYGPEHWLRRTLAILLIGSVGLLIVITLFCGGIVLLILAYLDYPVQTSLLLLLIGCGAVWRRSFLAKTFRKLINCGVQREAARWLSERHSGISSRERKWRIQGIRIASCIPVALVLLVFSFLFPIWGILSHFTEPDSGRLAHYRISIPLNWIILSHEKDFTGRGPLIRGIATKGLGVASLLKDWPENRSLSSWDIGFDPTMKLENLEWQDSRNWEIGRRSITIGSERVTCIDYLRPHSETWPEYVNIRCLGTEGLSANILGSRSQVDTFYKILNGITKDR